MKISEFPDSIEKSKRLMAELESRVENEPDREKRRELHLLRIELRDHIIRLEGMETVNHI